MDCKPSIETNGSGVQEVEIYSGHCGCRKSQRSSRFIVLMYYSDCIYHRMIRNPEGGVSLFVP